MSTSDLPRNIEVISASSQQSTSPRPSFRDARVHHRIRRHNARALASLELRHLRRTLVIAHRCCHLVLNVSDHYSGITCFRLCLEEIMVGRGALDYAVVLDHLGHALRVGEIPETGFELWRASCAFH